MVEHRAAYHVPQAEQHLNQKEGWNDFVVHFRL